MRTIAIINQKGGCGKTTTSINLAGMFARDGLRTLLIDLDPQSHCAAGLAIPEDRIDMDIGDAMLLPDHKPLDPARLLWRASRNLDLAPSRTKLAGLEAPNGGLAELPEKELRLKRTLERIQTDYDMCVIDCPPTIGLLTFNAISAADGLIIPVETSFFSLQGATRQLSTVRSVARRLGRIPKTWILPTIHDDSSPLARDLLGELKRRFGRKVIPVVIHRDQRLKEAASFGKPIGEYAPDTVAARDHADLARWFKDHAKLDIPDPNEYPDDRVDAVASNPPAPSQLIESTQSTHAPSPIPNQHPTPAPPAPPPPTAPHRAYPTIGASPKSPQLTPPITTLATNPSRSPLPTPATTSLRAFQSKSSSFLSPIASEQVSRAEDLARRATDLQRRLSELANKTIVKLDTHSKQRVQRAVGFIEPAAAVRSVSHLYGVRSTADGLLFVQPLGLGSDIRVAGDFNGWSGHTHKMRRNDALGVYELPVSVPTGRYQYRIVVDGRWIADPYNDRRLLNPFGEENSIASAKPTVATTPVPTPPPVTSRPVQPQPTTKPGANTIT